MLSAITHLRLAAAAWHARFQAFADGISFPRGEGPAARPRAHGASSVDVRYNNVLDRLAFGSGYASGGTNYVFPYATRHVMVSVRRAF